MNDDSSDSKDVSLPLPVLERIDGICLDFEAAWKAGETPRIEEYLGHAEDAERSQLFQDLLLLDLDYRSHPTPEEYQARFPHDRKLVGEVFQQFSTGAGLDETRVPGTVSTIAQQRPPGKFGGYELLEVLGEGGMGIVYRARQASADRIVALKVIRPDRLAAAAPEHQQEAMQRFRMEARAAAALEHDHIVPVYEVGEIDGQPFFSMRFVRGRSLEKVLRDGPLDAGKAAGLLEPIARAVHYAHGRGIVHRDIKPRNILLDTEERPYVADFGLAKSLVAARELTEAGHVLGTAQYMAPEQARGEAAGSAGDVYSLGATLYELLTGRPPFRAATPAETQRQVIDNEPVPPRRLNPAVPRDLETICLKCLEKEPHKRYSTAEDLADELERFQQGRPILARPITRVARTWRWCQRNPLVAGLSASLAAVIFVVAVTGPIVAVHQVSLRHTAGGLLEEKETLVGQLQQSLVREESAGKTARAERARAEANYQKALEAVRRLVQRFGEYRLQDIPYGDRLRRAVLQDALELFRGLAEQKGGDPDTRAEVARAQAVLGAIHGDMGNGAEAEKAYRRAAEALEALVREFPENPGYRETLAQTYLAMGRMLQSANRVPEAEGKLARARELIEPLYKKHPGVLKYGCCFAQILVERAGALDSLRRLPEAEAACQDAICLADEVVAQIGPETPPPDAERARTRQAAAYTRWGTFLCRRNRYPEAVEPLRKALDAFGKPAPGLQQPFATRGALFNIYYNLAAALLETGRSQEAYEMSNRALLLRERDAAEHPLVPKYQYDLGGALNNHALLLRARGKPGEACKALTRAILHQRRALYLEPHNPICQEFMSNHVANLVETWLHRGDDQRAEQAITAMAGSPGAFGPGLRSAILALGHVAQQVRADASRPPERREQLARCCLKAAKKLFDAGIANAQDAEGYHRWAWFLVSCPQVELRDPGRALEMAEKAVQGAPNVGRYRQTLGAAHYRAGNWQEALNALHEANQLQPATNWATWFLLAMTYWQLGEKETARMWYEKAVHWQNRHPRQSRELRRLVAEAAELLGVTAPPAGEPNALDSENGN